jgi:hypothetical protein
MKKFVSLLVVTSMLSPYAAFADAAMDGAKAKVQASMVTAKADASSLVNDDFQSLLMEMLLISSTTAQAPAQVQEFRKFDNELQKKIQETIEAIDESKSSDESVVLKLHQDYKNLFFERFKVALMGNHTSFMANQVFDNAQFALGSFRKQCEQGRSFVGANYMTPAVPNLPEANIEIMVKYGFGNGSSTGVTGSHATSDGKHTNDFGNALYTTTGVVSSIATSGQAGAVVNYCAAAAPYLLAAAAVYAVVSAYMAAQQQAEMQNDIARANEYAFMNIATSRDVAKFYKETCNKMMPIVDSISTQLMDIQSSDHQRLKYRSEALAHLDELNDYQQESIKITPVEDKMLLAYKALNDQCGASKNEALSKNQTCFAANDNYFDLRNEQVVVPKDKSKLKEIYESSMKVVKDFGLKFPIEKQVDFLRYKVSLAFGESWDLVESELLNFSFDQLDRQMHMLLNKVLTVLSLYRKSYFQKDQASQKIMDEMGLIDKFEGLKKSYRSMVKMAINVVLGRQDNKSFIAELQKFKKAADAFNRKYFGVKEVQEFSALVNQLEQLSGKI